MKGPVLAWKIAGVLFEGVHKIVGAVIAHLSCDLVDRSVGLVQQHFGVLDPKVIQVGGKRLACGVLKNAPQVGCVGVQREGEEFAQMREQIMSDINAMGAEELVAALKETYASKAPRVQEILGE